MLVALHVDIRRHALLFFPLNDGKEREGRGINVGKRKKERGKERGKERDGETSNAVQLIDTDRTDWHGNWY